jgi:hypothetical protein
MKKLLVTSSFLLLLLFGPKAASASFIYQFSGTTTNIVPGGGFAQGFQIITNTLVSTPTLFYVPDVIPGSCLACDPPPALAAEFFSPAVPGPYDRLGAFTSNTEWQYYFPLGAFVTPGTYFTATGLNTGTLQVTTAVPEPSTLLLLCCAIVGIGLQELRRVI